MNIKQELPLIPLISSVIFPNTEKVLSFGRKKSITAIETSLEPGVQNKLSPVVVSLITVVTRFPPLFKLLFQLIHHFRMLS